MKQSLYFFSSSLCISNCLKTESSILQTTNHMLWQYIFYSKELFASEMMPYTTERWFINTWRMKEELDNLYTTL